MADEPAQTRECPYCKEEVKAEAARCKHCQAAIPPATPAHHGVCPYCKETINPEATRCKHCLSNLMPSGAGHCSWGESAPAAITRAVRRRVSGGGRPAPRKAVERAAERALVFEERYPDPPPGCAATDLDEDGLWCFLEASEHYCIYELCAPGPGPTLPT
jgi:hypothetical protein